MSEIIYQHLGVGTPRGFYASIYSKIYFTTILFRRIGCIYFGHGVTLPIIPTWLPMVCVLIMSGTWRARVYIYIGTYTYCARLQCFTAVRLCRQREGKTIPLYACAILGDDDNDNNKRTHDAYCCCCCWDSKRR